MIARSLRSARALAVAVSAGALLVLSAGSASAANGSIDLVQEDGSDLQVVFAVDDVADDVVPDTATVTVTMGGEPVEATATLLDDAGDQITRTSVLALDTSESMEGAKFAAAQEAANAFLDNVPEGVAVGLVTYAGTVDVAVEPTTDLDSVREVIDGLTLSRGTLLYQGISAALEASGDEGARNVLVLSDGADTSDTPLDDTLAGIEESGVTTDVVSLGKNPANVAILEQLAEAGNGRVIPAGDPAALAELFAAEASALSQQVLLTVTPPAELVGQETTMSVTVQVDGEPVTDEAFVAVPDPSASGPGGGEINTTLKAAEPSGFQLSKPLMLVGLGLATLALLVLVLMAVGIGPREKQDEIDKSIEAYTRKGAKKIAEANKQQQESQGVTKSAVAVAESVLSGQKGLEASLNMRLEAAGLAIKPAEWLLIHAGITVGLGLIGVLFGGGNLLFMLLAVALGVIGPWFYLRFKKSRRISAFKGQMADTLQLMAGSLSAGLSLAQSLDTVVREGSDPVASEFRRALVEARLGVEIEDALADVATRMDSVDFEWVVMAIRIQREVGGNLAELLNKVAETIREREYLERQVKTLSAEGRLSVWILGGLPPAFMAYLMIANPSYVMPLFTTPLGIVMLVVMGILLIAGILWMKQVIKVEV